AIIPALIVTSAGQRYAVPQVSLLELVRLDEGAANHIEYVGGSPVYRLRGRLLALLDLAEQLGTARTGSAPETTTIVVLQADGQSFGLIVDDVHDTEEIVVKPLGDQLKGIQALSGVTIMGDGRVAVILDVAGLARRAGLIGSNGDQLVALEGEHSDAAGEVSGEALLLVRVGATQLAMPQARVDRLEEIEAGALERAGDHDAVQYRGSIMPVLRLDQVVGRAAGDAPDAGHLQMIVVSCADERPMGIVVDSVVDIVEEQTQLDTDTARSGTLGSLVVAGHITDLIDIDALALGLGRARQPGGETARRAA
ncbi:MAG TPA: chemotaxis protein CheW, partial [Acidimicrobiales bacterium]|nr:chemotaxis protein CheW [Acidimicrobiales bacterium]